MLASMQLLLFPLDLVQQVRYAFTLLNFPRILLCSIPLRKISMDKRSKFMQQNDPHKGSPSMGGGGGERILSLFISIFIPISHGHRLGDETQGRKNPFVESGLQWAIRISSPNSLVHKGRPSTLDIHILGDNAFYSPRHHVSWKCDTHP